MEKHILSPEGRITPMAYWSRAAVAVIILIISFYLFRNNQKLVLVQLGLQFVVTVFMWIQGVKRLHDSNKNGWHLLIPIYGFVLLLAPGTRGANEYGEDPGEDKGILNDRQRDH